MIQVEHLTKRFGDNVAVEDLSFTAEPGRIYGFLGPNGAGKTTTMNMMTGYLAASSGEVKIEGFDILRQPEEAKQKIGYLPEIPPVYTDMTVLEYLRFAAELKRVPASEREEAVKKAMAKTELVDVKGRLIRNLSKGYRQRVGLAQAVINNPAVVILDEPTAGLDPEQQKEMFDYIRSMREEHTIILSSHILSDINAVCDYVWIINKGHLVASDTPEGLRASMSASEQIVVEAGGTSEALSAALRGIKGVDKVTVTEGKEEAIFRAFVTCSSGEKDLRPEVAAALVGAGIPLYSLGKSETSLEDVFLTLTQEDTAETAAVAPEAEE